MSYEGYEQCLCENGHYFIKDAWDEERPCPYCQSPIVWENSVDETNCDSVGFIQHEDLNKFIIAPRVMEKCECCGQVKPSAPAIYRIPTKEETEAIRTISEFGEVDVKYLKDIK